ncbi:hypothetical protein PABG_06629 [Paracoccidioides brasiliensis Pb03]|nr:hypothetical protein PABG_06629 [Paracoccidioides brasiliensis Pb03]
MSTAATRTSSYAKRAKIRGASYSMTRLEAHSDSCTVLEMGKRPQVVLPSRYVEIAEEKKTLRGGLNVDGVDHRATVDEEDSTTGSRNRICVRRQRPGNTLCWAMEEMYWNLGSSVERKANK